MFNFLYLGHWENLIHRHKADNIKQVTLEPSDKDYICMKAAFLKTFKPGGIKEAEVRILEASLFFFAEQLNC